VSVTSTQNVTGGTPIGFGAPQGTGVTAGVNWGRNYELANSGSNGISTTLYESFVAVYTPPSPVNPTVMTTGSAVGFNTPSFGVAWLMGSPPTVDTTTGTKIMTNATTYDPNSGQWTVNIYVSTPNLSLPSYPQGAQWPIGYGAPLESVITGNQPGSNMEKITMTYKASFEPGA
jgi:hypothetical protein